MSDSSRRPELKTGGARIHSTFCAVKESAIALAATNLCRWPQGHVITWTIEERLTEFSDEEYSDVCEMAWGMWEAKSGVRLEYVTGGRPNIILTTRRIDGEFGILAEAELPCGNITPQSQLRMWADSSESWVNAQNPSGRMIDALRVIAHEFGHLLGLSHITKDRALMNPAVSEIRTLQALDIEQAVLRYGDSSTTPPPSGGVNLCGGLLNHLFTDPEDRKTAFKGWELLKRAVGGRE